MELLKGTIKALPAYFYYKKYIQLSKENIQDEPLTMIQTERLILRNWKDADLEAFAKINACPHVCEFFPKRLTQEESDMLAGDLMIHFEEHGYGLFAVEIKETGDFIGFTGLNIPDFEAPFMPAVEIGWRLAYQHWGKGYATEAAQAAKEYAFNELGLRELVAFTVPQNIRSQRVMEKIGMTHDDKDDFDHPKLEEGHPMRRHVLYRVGVSGGGG